MDNVVSLKKAHAYQQELDVAHNAINVNNLIDVSFYVSDNVETIMAKAIANLDEKMTRKLLILQARYSLRKLIDDANHSEKLSGALTYLTYINRQITIIETFLKTIPDSSDTLAVIKNKLNRLMSIENNYTDSLKLPVIVKSSGKYGELVNQLAQLKRERVQYKDFIDKVNITATITIPDDVMAVLMAENIF